MSTETLNHSSRTSHITFGTPARVATKLCEYCGWNIEEQDLEILSFFHCDCWKEYRKDGLLHPMPEDFW
jgi:hypothetical protein